MINEAGPDIVWVGLGCPKQERWMAEHIDRLHAPALIGVGAAFDFHAGLKSKPPAGCNGMAWNTISGLVRATPAGATIRSKSSAVCHAGLIGTPRRAQGPIG